MVLLSLAIFLLTFMSLTLIYRIKSLRQAGIRLIAGESLFGVALRPVLEDVRQLICSVLVSSLWDWGFSGIKVPCLWQRCNWSSLLFYFMD